MLRITLVMKHEGRTARWLAGRLGVTEGHVSRLLRGNRTWTPELREKVKAVLGRGDELFDEVASVLSCPVCGGEGIVEMPSIRIAGRITVRVCPVCEGLGIVVVAEDKETGGQGDKETGGQGEREGSAGVSWECVPW